MHRKDDVNRRCTEENRTKDTQRVWLLLINEVEKGREDVKFVSGT